MLMNQRPVSNRMVLAPFRLALMTGKMAYWEGIGIWVGNVVEMNIPEYDVLMNAWRLE